MATFEVIVGKQGTQKFPIKNAGVSRQHARIIIDDRGQWVLEDLNSTNGTFVRDEKGEYQRVSRIGIQEDTVIRLGDESNNGYSFMAHHVVEDDPDNYAYEFARIRQWREDFRKERDRCQSQTRNKGLIQIFLSVAIIGITFIPAIEQPNDDIAHRHVVAAALQFFRAGEKQDAKDLRTPTKVSRLSPMRPSIDRL